MPRPGCFAAPPRPPSTSQTRRSPPPAPPRPSARTGRSRTPRTTPAMSPWAKTARASAPIPACSPVCAALRSTSSRPTRPTRSARTATAPVSQASITCSHSPSFGSVEQPWEHQRSLSRLRPKYRQALARAYQNDAVLAAYVLISKSSTLVARVLRQFLGRLAITRWNEAIHVCWKWMADVIFLRSGLTVCTTSSNNLMPLANSKLAVCSRDTDPGRPVLTQLPAPCAGVWVGAQSRGASRDPDGGRRNAGAGSQRRH